MLTGGASHSNIPPTPSSPQPSNSGQGSQRLEPTRNQPVSAPRSEGDGRNSVKASSVHPFSHPAPSSLGSWLQPPPSPSFLRGTLFMSRFWGFRSLCSTLRL